MKDEEVVQLLQRARYLIGKAKMEYTEAQEAYNRKIRGIQDACPHRTKATVKDGDKNRSVCKMCGKEI